jgi:L-Ala-D/L-Glu epimerase
MPCRRLSIHTEQLKLSSPFRISGYVWTHSNVVVATIGEGDCEGRGEASGVYYTGDDVAHMLAAIESVRAAIEDGADRAELQGLLPPGGGRNALDCALWELESRTTGRRAWELAGLDAPQPLVTTFTLGADQPDRMAQGAKNYAQARSVKIKLTGELDLDLERVRAIRAARPDLWLAVDANQGFSASDLDYLVAGLVEARVSLLEQPLRRGQESALQGYGSPIPIAADESALGLADLPGLLGRFDVVNIKLDKCGGLTEGLQIAAEARRLGLGVMVGNMVGTSLAMAPAYLLGQLCDVVDLDGPTFLERDREPGVRYHDGLVDCPPGIWG